MNLNRLKEIREDKDVTQEQIAKVLKISRTYYTNIENKIRIITLNKLLLFINFFNVSFDYALGLTNKRQYSEFETTTKIDYHYLGQNIKNIRVKNNVSQKELADAIDTSRSCISCYELGDAKISTNNLCKIARYFNVSIDQLVRKPICNN